MALFGYDADEISDVLAERHQELLKKFYRLEITEVDWGVSVKMFLSENQRLIFTLTDMPGTCGLLILANLAVNEQLLKAQLELSRVLADMGDYGGLMCSHARNYDLQQALYDAGYRRLRTVYNPHSGRNIALFFLVLCKGE